MTDKNLSYFLIIGIGASGCSMAKFLHSKGENVIVTDIDASKDNTEIVKELNKLGIETQIGFHDQNTFNRAKIMIPSPGVPLNNKYITTALNNGIELTGELDIFQKYNSLPIIAISGTNGKTTVTTLIGEILKHSKIKPFVGGNIGTPLMEYLIAKKNPKTAKKADVIVAEISSFQLDLSKKFKPDVGILLNISEDHLDRYKNYGEYTNSKWSLFKNQKPSDIAVVNQTIHDFDHQSKKLDAKVITFSSKNLQTRPDNVPEKENARINSKEIEITLNKNRYKIPTENLKEFQGTHNMENIAAAAVASLCAGADFNDILKGLNTFKNLSHRVEFTKTIKGVSFYNDSKATNTDAVIRAIECFKLNNITLILGGRAKQTDFSLLEKHIKESVKNIIAIGETQKTVQNLFGKICPVQRVTTMENAVQTAFSSSIKDDIVLFSPACASFDMYKNYVQRGNDFKDCVKALEQTKIGKTDT